MKKLLIMVIALGLTAMANAQHVRKGGYYHARPRVYVSAGNYAPFYPYYYGYGPFWGYPPYWYPYGYESRPSKMTMKIEDIRNDYQDKIWSARRDHSLPRKERKEKVRELKHQRDQEIADLKRNYYKN